MLNFKLIFKFQLKVFICFSLSWSAWGDVSVLQETLNAVKDLALADGEERAAFCEKWREKGDVLGADGTRNGPLSKYFQTVYKTRCEEKSEGAEVEGGFWNTSPYCRQDTTLVHCDHNHKTGKGLFIMKKEGEEKYLVCATNAGSFEGFLGIHSGYRIQHQCENSTVKFQGHLNSGAASENVRMRSDVKGLLKWLDQLAKRKPIQMPALLLDQCQAAFPEANYCSPFFMALPTGEADKVDTCGLMARGDAVNVPFFNLHYKNSRWVCNRRDLSGGKWGKRNLRPREGFCIPDRWSRTHPRCHLPYFPETEEKIRVKGKFSYVMSRPLTHFSER